MRLHVAAVFDDEEAGAIDAVNACERGVDEVTDGGTTGSTHDQRTAIRIVRLDASAGDGPGEFDQAGGAVEGEGGCGVVQRAGNDEAAVGDVVADQCVEACGVETAGQCEGAGI